MNNNMEIHIGKKIKKVLKEQGRSIVWLSKQLNYSRTGTSDILRRKDIDTYLLKSVSVLLNYDFFQWISLEMQNNT
jgi:hypothetical protein